VNTDCHTSIVGGVTVGVDKDTLHVEKTAGRETYTYTYVWRRGSVVRTSVYSRRTFPNLRLIHG